MENQLSGTTTSFYGISGSRGLRKSIAKQLHHWLEKWDAEILGNDVNYAISFERKGDGHEILCQTEIWDGLQRLWVSSDSGTNPHEALERCLRRVGNHALNYRGLAFELSA